MSLYADMMYADDMMLYRIIRSSYYFNHCIVHVATVNHALYNNIMCYKVHEHIIVINIIL